MKNLFLIILATLVFGCQHAPIRYPSSESKLTPKKEVSSLKTIANKHVLIVTHATSEFDEEKMAKEDIDKIVSSFKEKGRPVIYLVSDQSAIGYERWYTKDRSPDYEVFSEGGEHNLPITFNDVTIIGGFFGSTDTLNGCHALSMKDAIRMHFEVSKSPLTIHVPIRATYFYFDFMNLRNSLIEKGKVDTSLSGIEKNPFASIYFLREGNQGAGDDGNEQNFAHQYTGSENKNYRPGIEVDRKNYKFNFYVNDQLIESVEGPGKKIVNIKMEI